MCHLCNRFSRRRFLRWSLTALASFALPACESQDSVGTMPTAVPTAIVPTPHPTSTMPATSFPASPVALRLLTAGQMIEATSNSVVLGYPLGQKSYPLSPNLIGVEAFIGQTVLLWVDTEGVVNSITLSPPMSATETIPAGLTQTAPTEQTMDVYGVLVLTRAGWGADSARPDNELGFFEAETNPNGYLVYTDPLSRWLNTIVVHHSALEWADGPRAIQRLHILENQFADIGYHFLIDAGGQVYEGRPLNIRGAHTGGHNTGTVGVCLLGNFEVTQPTQLQLNSLVSLASALKEPYSISHLTGHQGFQPNATLCPGENLWPLLPDLALQAGLAFGEEGYERPFWHS